LGTTLVAIISLRIASRCIQTIGLYAELPGSQKDYVL
jgi:hypothetical protein